MRVATLNVHGWRTPDDQDNLRALEKVIRPLAVDILLLQEVARRQSSLRALAADLGFGYYCYFPGDRHIGNAILARQPLLNCRAIPLGEGRTAGMAMVGSMTVVVVHLCHLWEPNRQRQLAKLRPHLAKLSHVIIGGDFNALTRDDYDEQQWEELITSRRRDGWEAPQTVVMEEWRSSYRDAALSYPYRGTCRFDTRIDYLLLSPELRVRDYRVVDSKGATDHRMVLITVNTI